MKRVTTTLLCAGALCGCATTAEQTPKRLYMDVHQLDAVTATDVAAAHEKDLAVQERFGVRFIKYWVDEENARVYCLAEADEPHAVSEAHRHAHGLVPQRVHAVSEGEEAHALGGRKLFLDLHRVGPGTVTARDVARAHEQDLETQGKHGVNFINYWVDPESGDIFCLSEAPNAQAVLETHRQAHGLVSDEIAEVVQGE